jgi:hypothetical protein
VIGTGTRKVADRVDLADGDTRELVTAALPVVAVALTDTLVAIAIQLGAATVLLAGG